MNSAILQIASKYIVAILITFGIIALFRGHNSPGGGFIGGLLVGLAIVYKGFAFTPEQVYLSLKIKPQVYIAIGLFLILLSVVPSIVVEAEIMTALWMKVTLLQEAELKLGTPILFDLGVFFIVIGVVLSFMFSIHKA